jgi:hypothetical protein
MPRATNNDGSLAPLQYTDFGAGKCEIQTPCGCITLKILPDITDSKGALYQPDNAPGRSSPMTTYSYSEARTISTDLHFMITQFSDISDNLRSLRIIQSLVYPGPQSATAPFTPPPVVRFICGVLMDGIDGLCLVLKNYSVKYDPGVAWDVATFLPYRFSVNCNWEVVYSCNNLPTNKCIALGSDVFYPGDLSGLNPRSGFYTKDA